jgi:hypothetical protein
MDLLGLCLLGLSPWAPLLNEVLPSIMQRFADATASSAGSQGVLAVVSVFMVIVKAISS